MKRAIVALALILAACTPACPPHCFPDKEVAIGSTAFDLTTTHIARQRGAAEANPILKNEAVSVALNAAIVYGAVKLSEHYKALGYSNWYLPLRLVSVVHVGAGAWNLTQMRSTR